jgi:hypothetical protein
MAVKGRLIPVPNLDDRDWRAIKDEIIRAIPKRAPEWTDHNLSDPGVTLVEAFALQIEQLTTSRCSRASRPGPQDRPAATSGFDTRAVMANPVGFPVSAQPRRRRDDAS